MNDPTNSSAAKIRQASAYINAGQKTSARQILREILIDDSNNLTAWELLTRATKNDEELVYCLKRILRIQPQHPWAGQELDRVTVKAGVTEFAQESRSFRDSTINLGNRSSLPQTSTPSLFPSSAPPEKSTTHRPPTGSSRKRKRKIPAIIYISGALGILCLAVWGYIFLFMENPPLDASRQSTLTAAFMQEVSCQVLIEQAMQAAGTSCDQIGPNSVCYGNFTIQAELLPDAPVQFTQQGDIIDVQYLQRLSAAPLNIASNEWGIAIFKVMANLPRSLPGETVTLMVFGNTTIDNQSPTLETFYFSSQLGQLVCAQVPFDGIMINTPDGSGVRFNINGTELTLMGDASLTANPGGEMTVNLYSGSGVIVSNGQEQFFGAGQSVSVQLGGENGMQAISGPSAPVPLSPADLEIACTMSGQYCSETEVTPVSEQEAQNNILTNLGITPTITPAVSFTPSRSATVTLTPTPTRTTTRTGTATRTPTPTRTGTRTATGIYTASATRTPTPTTTPTFTSVTSTATATRTFTPVTSTATATRTFTPVTPTATNTPTFTPVPPTSTPTATSAGITICHCTDYHSNCSSLDFPSGDIGGHASHVNDIIPAPDEGCPP